MSLTEQGRTFRKHPPGGLLSKCEVRDRFLTVFREYVHPHANDGRVTPSRVAAALRIDTKTVRNWLQGDNLPSLEMTINMRRLFGAEFVERIYGDMVAVEQDDIDSAAALRDANRLARIERALRDIEAIEK